MRTIILNIALLTLAFYGFSQAPKLFPNQVLSSPKMHAAWFDSTINVCYVKEYPLVAESNVLLLENGYVKYEIVNKETISDPYFDAQPIYVDIVFSRYPSDKRCWKTNYYELLANRLKELFRIDSSLNSSKVNWRLVLQTNCSNEPEAMRLFHGIAVGYQLPTPAAPSNPPSAVEPDTLKPEGNTPINPAGVEYYPLGNDPEIPSRPFPERKIRPIPESKQKKWKEPSCPSFKTRADKPKRRIFSRFFR